MDVYVIIVGTLASMAAGAVGTDPKKTFGAHQAKILKTLPILNVVFGTSSSFNEQYIPLMRFQASLSRHSMIMLPQERHKTESRLMAC